MDLKLLKLFVHLAESCHFAKTAKLMYISPSALSRQIQRLEEQLGCRLFLRDNRTVQLTDSGRLFQQFAKQTLTNYCALQVMLQQHEQILSGELPLFCSVTAAYSHLPPLLDRYRSAHPFVEIKLTTGDAADAVERLQSHHAGLAITAYPEQLPTNLLFTKIGEEPLVLIAPIGPCSVSHQISQAHPDWSTVPFIVPEHGLSRQRLEQWFKQQGIYHPVIYATVAGHEAITPMVALGCGVALIPNVVLQNCPEMMRQRIQVMPLADRIPPFELGVCTLKKRLAEPLIQAFWQILTAVP